MTDYDHAEQLKNLALIEASFGPLRQRVVVAEAVCEALLETKDTLTPGYAAEKLKRAIEEYQKLKAGQ